MGCLLLDGECLLPGGLLPGGSVCSWGVCPQGVYALGGVYSWGCLLPGVSALGGLSTPGGVSAPGGCLLWGAVCSQGEVSALEGCLLPGGIPACTEADTSPEAELGIRSISGRYASYWNAFLLRRCECDATPYVEQPEVKECFVEHCINRLSRNEDDLILGWRVFRLEPFSVRSGNVV